MNKIDSKRLMEYINTIKVSHKNNIELGLYSATNWYDGEKIGKQLFLSQINIEDQMHSPTFIAKRIIDYDRIMNLTCKEHIESIYCTCNSLDNNLLASLLGEEGIEDKPCTCKFDYEKMSLEILQNYVTETINE